MRGNLAGGCRWNEKCRSALARHYDCDSYNEMRLLNHTGERVNEQ